MIKRNITLFIILLFYQVTVFCPVHAAIDTKSFFQNVLAMYKWNSYLPALDMLEEHQPTSYKKELFKAIGFQKTHQLNKALNAYKKALSLNPKARNLTKRVKIIQAKIEIGQKTISLNSHSEKAIYLLKLAKLTKNKNPDLAYRYFIQAYEYNQELNNNDNGMISEAIVFYKSNLNNKSRFPKLFHAIFLQIQGDNRIANLELNEVLYRKDIPEHLKKLGNRFLQQSEKIETARKIALEKELKETATKLSKQNRKAKENDKVFTSNNQPTELVALKQKEKLPEAGASAYLELTEVNPNSPYSKYIKKKQDKLMEQLENNPDESEKRKIIRALGNLHTQDPVVMAKLLHMIDTPKLEEVNHILETIVKIGAPSAKTAIPYLLPLIEKDNPKTRLWVMEALGNLKIEANKVIPAMFKEYKTTTTANGERLIYKYIANFGQKAVPVLRKMLSEEIGPNKRPIAKFLSKMTGETVSNILEE